MHLRAKTCCFTGHRSLSGEEKLKAAVRLRRVIEEQIKAGTETAAPAGYNKLVAPIKVTIDHEGNVNYATKTTADGQYGDGVSANATQGIKVLNQTGTELPSTGGMGTTIFYVLGSILVVAAVVLLVTKKRMSASDK